MTIVILTGPAASGKNTIAQLLAQTGDRAADIDVDLVRWMYRKPHAAPWDGPAGITQMKLGVENACLLARSFAAHGLDIVVITDVVLNETVDIYRSELAGLNPVIVRLLPTWAESLRRLHGRKPTISDEEAQWVYETQENLRDFDVSIDNTHVAADEVVREIATFLKQ